MTKFFTGRLRRNLEHWLASPTDCRSLSSVSTSVDVSCQYSY